MESLPSPFSRIEPAELESVHYADVVVIGAGVAGLSAALGCSPRLTVVLTKGGLERGSASLWAQGGVAAAVGEEDGSGLHAADTLSAAAGLADEEAVEILTRQGPEAIARLIELGAVFDRDPDGALALGREGAHARRRILHARGDATGAELVRALAAAVRKAPGVSVVEDATVLDLVLEGGPRGRRVRGALAEVGGRRRLFLSSAVVLATGGVGRLFLHTTNPPAATGDGLAMAARAGARLADLEFVQFHPTALAAVSERPLAAVSEAVSAGGAPPPLPLVTEALRGEGAVLVDEEGERFMVAEHPHAELAPRDIVARAIHRRLATGGKVFLDAREVVGECFPERFPTVFGSCGERGIDPRSQPISITPAMHYHMGGVAVDADGRSSLPGLWACGEVTSTGVHGANRLASNSLLEGLVFGERVARDLAHRPVSVPRTDDRRALARLVSAVPSSEKASAGLSRRIEAEIRALMWKHVGLVRCDRGLRNAEAVLAGLWRDEDRLSPETRNLLTVARLIAAAARARRESRGGHFREDHPVSSPTWRRRLFARLVAAPGADWRVVLEPGELLSPAAVGAPAAAPAMRRRAEGLR